MGLNKARQFKINFLCFAVYNTAAVTNSLNYTVHNSLPVPDLTRKVCFIY